MFYKYAQLIKFSQDIAHAGLVVVAITVIFVVVQMIKHTTVDHFLLPLDGDCSCAELLVEFLIPLLKLNVFDDGGFH